MREARTHIGLALALWEKWLGEDGVAQPAMAAPRAKRQSVLSMIFP
jgi:hypothetical protein